MWTAVLLIAIPLIATAQATSEARSTGTTATEGQKATVKGVRQELNKDKSSASGSGNVRWFASAYFDFHCPWAECREINKDALAGFDEVSADSKDSTRATAAMLQMQLGAFGYGTRITGDFDAPTVAALKAYQSHRGIAPTGTLDSVTKQRLMGDWRILRKTNVGLLRPAEVNVESWTGGYATAKGTWVLTNDQMGIPFQTSDFRCYKANGFCIEATAMIIPGRATPDSLFVDTDIYPIERWDEFEIVTKPLDFGCTRYVRRFNRTQGHVTGTRSTIKGGGECDTVAQHEFHMVLGNGNEVYFKAELELLKSQANLLLIDGTANAQK